MYPPKNRNRKKGVEVKMALNQAELKKMGAIYPLSHPARASIVKLLKKKGKAYPAQIARDLGLSERLISFHLSVLRSSKFVDSEYALSNPSKNPARVVRYYHLTDKVDSALADFINNLK